MERLDFENAIKQGHEHISRNSRYDVNIKHLLSLYNKPKIDALYDSFAFGFIQGMKAEKAKMKSRSAM